MRYFQRTDMKENEVQLCGLTHHFARLNATGAHLPLAWEMNRVVPRIGNHVSILPRPVACRRSPFSLFARRLNSQVMITTTLFLSSLYLHVPISLFLSSPIQRLVTETMSFSSCWNDVRCEFAPLWFMLRNAQVFMCSSVHTSILQVVRDVKLRSLTKQTVCNISHIVCQMIAI